jgi:hypothetical protein
VVKVIKHAILSIGEGFWRRGSEAAPNPCHALEASRSPSEGGTLHVAHVQPLCWTDARSRLARCALAASGKPQEGARASTVRAPSHGLPKSRKWPRAGKASLHKPLILRWLFRRLPR